MTQRHVAVVASEILGMPGIGGPGTADSLLALGLARSGHRVELLVAPGRDVVALAPEWADRYSDAGVNVRRLEDVRIEPQFLKATASVYQVLRADPPDAVLAITKRRID